MVSKIRTRNKLKAAVDFGQPRRFNPYANPHAVGNRYKRKEEKTSALIYKMMLEGNLLSSRYGIDNLWQLGVELIGQVAPEQLTNFLHSCYIASPSELRVIIFDAYTENLMLEEKWETALDELEVRCSRPKFQRAQLLEKLKICKAKVEELKRRKSSDSEENDV
ncbi:unnamed protein product [Rhizopus stolonifer]